MATLGSPILKLLELAGGGAAGTSPLALRRSVNARAIAMNWSSTMYTGIALVFSLGLFIGFIAGLLARGKR